MSLSLSVHPLTQRKQSHFGSVLSHFKPQRSCTYSGMLSRKQNQNSATSTTVHLQGKKKRPPLCTFNNYPKAIMIWWNELQNQHFAHFSKTEQCYWYTTVTISSHTTAAERAWPAALGWQGKDCVLPCTLLSDKAAYDPRYFFWTGIIVNNYLKHINHQFLRNTRSSARKELKAFVAL